MDDWIISDELNLRVSHVLGGMAASAMVVGGVIPYGMCNQMFIVYTKERYFLSFSFSSCQSKEKVFKIQSIKKKEQKKSPHFINKIVFFLQSPAIPPDKTNTGCRRFLTARVSHASDCKHFAYFILVSLFISMFFISFAFSSKPYHVPDINPFAFRHKNAN